MPSAPLRAVSSAKATTASAHPRLSAAVCTTSMFLEIPIPGNEIYDSVTAFEYVFESDGQVLTTDAGSIYGCSLHLTTPAIYIDATSGPYTTRLTWQQPAYPGAPTVVPAFFLHGYSLSTGTPGTRLFANNPTTGGYSSGASLVLGSWGPDAIVGGPPYVVGTDMELVGGGLSFTSPGIQINTTGFYSFNATGFISLFYATSSGDPFLMTNSF